jgi:hypothetical protein
MEGSLMSNELRKILEETVLALSKYCPVIFPGETEENREECEVSLPAFELSTPEHESEALQLH